MANLRRIKKNNKTHITEQCLCDFIEDEVVHFKRLVCFDFDCNKTTIIDRTEDLSQEYIIQGEVKCCEGDAVQLETLPFCNDGKTFYRVIDVISGNIIHQFSDNPNVTYTPVGEVKAGSCGETEQDKECCETPSTQNGVLNQW